MTALCVNAALALYLAACVLYVVDAVAPRRLFIAAAGAVFFAGFLANAAAIAVRWRAAGHPPLSNLHETMVVFACTIALAQLIAALGFGAARPLGGISAFLALCALGYASVLDAAARPLMPALRSNWIVIHVSAYLVGYGAAAVACAAGAGQFVIRRGLPGRREAAERLDALGHRLVLLAFPFLTVGITTGSVWANVAWGNYWSWDPKETWSLVTWLIYALYLHLRGSCGWRGRRAALVSIAGFCAILVTFIGVSRLWSGLHSYA